MAGVSRGERGLVGHEGFGGTRCRGVEMTWMWLGDARGSEAPPASDNRHQTPDRVIFDRNADAGPMDVHLQVRVVVGALVDDSCGLLECACANIATRPINRASGFSYEVEMGSKMIRN